MATRAVAISPNGRWVCGWYESGGRCVGNGFWYDTTTHEFHDFLTPGDGWTSGCSDINDNGWLVGTMVPIKPFGDGWGFVYDVNTLTMIAELPPHPDAAWCDIHGINSSGVVCGQRWIGSPSNPFDPSVGYRWTLDGGFEELDVKPYGSNATVAIADDGFAIVAVSVDRNLRLWDGTEVKNYGKVPNALGTYGMDIANGRHVVGQVSGFELANGWTLRPFEFKDDRFRVLAVLEPEFPYGRANTSTRRGTLWEAWRTRCGCPNAPACGSAKPSSTSTPCFPTIRRLR